MKFIDFENEKKVFYLIRHIGQAKYTFDLDTVDNNNAFRKQSQAAVKAAKALGIELKIIPCLLKKQKNDDQYRYFFRFRQYKRNDPKAQRIAESFIFAIELLYGPTVDYSETSTVFMVPATLLRGSEAIYSEELEKFSSELVSPFGAMFLPWQITEFAWRITPVIFFEDRIHRALMFLRASQHHFCLTPPSEILNIGLDLVAENSFEQEHWENSLLNSYKAVEAIIGDLPKDDKKFFSRLQSIGLDPDEKVGFINKRCLKNEIREMNKARDKKSAHGVVPKRQIKLREVINYQECAKHIIQADIKTVEHTLFKDTQK